MKYCSWILHEMHLQWKNGMYLVYVFVNLLYIFILGYVPGQYKDMAMAFIIFLDPTFLGMMFVGSIFLLEKNQGIPRAIGVSPLGSKGYIVGKVLSLLVISLISAYVIVFVYKGSNFNAVGLLFGVGITASVFTMIGIILGTYASSINDFLIFISGGSLLLSLPILPYYDILQINFLKGIPTYSSLRLINQAVQKQQTCMIDVVYLAVILGVCYKLTGWVVEKKIFVG